jgi:hypothetical protein
VNESFENWWLLLAILPLLIALGLARNFQRARRWDQKVRAHGNVHCRSCGYVGELLVRTISAGDANSSNLRLVCGQCNSSDWFIPEAEKAA